MKSRYSVSWRIKGSTWQAQGQLWAPLQVAAHKVVLADAHFQGGGAGIVHGGGAVLLGQRQHTQNATHCRLSVLVMHPAAKGSDLQSGFARAAQQVERARRCLL